MLKPVRAVVYDLDGTVLDSLPKHYVAIKAVCDYVGANVPPFSTMCQWWHSPVMPCFRALGVFLPKEIIWPIYDLALGDRYFPVFPGAKDVLAGLERRGIDSFVITASPYAEKVAECLAMNGLTGFFKGVYCDQEDKVSDLRDIMARNGFSPDEVIFVGDMVSDISDGVLAGVRTFGFDCGCGGHEVLIKAGAETVMKSHQEIFSYLNLNDG